MSVESVAVVHLIVLRFHRMRRLVGSVLFFVVVGCAAPFPQNPNHPEGLVGRSFTVDTVVVGGQAMDLLPNVQPGVYFGPDVMSVGGCNGWTIGPWLIEGYRLVIEPYGAHSDLTDCPQAERGQDQWFVDFFRSGPTVVVDGDVLIAVRGDTIMSLSLAST